MKAITWKDETIGAEYVDRRNSRRLQKKAEAFHAQLVEAVAENDDDMLHKFLEGEEHFRRRATGFAAQVDHRAESISGRGGYVRSKIKAFSRCSMRWSIICLRRSICRRNHRALIPTTERSI